MNASIELQSGDRGRSAALCRDAATMNTQIELQSGDRGYVWRDLRRMPLEMWRNLREKPELGVGLFLVLGAGVALHWVATGLEECIQKILEGQRPSGTLVWFT